MTVLNKLATSLSRRDEKPNVLLAVEITESNDKKAIKELVENLNNKNKDIQNDCIKVLYEIGERNPSLISAYSSNFMALLDSKNNRLQWGAMTALNTIAGEKPDTVYAALPALLLIAEKGSVITKDNFMGLLIKLCAAKKYHDDVLLLFNEQLLTSPVNQLPTYAENALPCIDEKHKTAFVKTLTSRLSDFEKGTKLTRLEKVLKKLKK